MDDLRVVVTVVSFLVFVGIAVWAFSRRRKRDFDEAARLHFTGKDFDAPVESNNRKETER
jgi:cytochrome c oxidase cbb3-type subunit 4